MGIRFYCPNGHKLNVKKFQAGRKGICPVCGTSMDIPLESVRPGRQSSAAILAKIPATAASSERVAAPVDPLAESGSAAWYVRPASGGQFGPATAAVMRSWLAEGRIGLDTLVWREGWRDWREASDVFANLAAAAATLPNSDEMTAPTSAAPSGSPSVSRSGPGAPAWDRAWLFIGALAAAVLILIIVLFAVLTRRS